MFRSSLRLKALFCKKPLKPPEIFSEDKLLTMAKMASIAMMVVMAGVSGYFWLTQEKRGRKRAEDYQQSNPDKPPRPKILPDEFQPEYIKEQRSKYQQVVEDRKRRQSPSVKQY